MEYSGSGGGGGGHGGHHGVPSFQDLFLGIELGAAVTGHSVSIADAAAAAMFVGVALDHGGGFEFSGFPTGYAQDVPALQGAGPQGPDGPTYTAPGRELNLPGIARSATTVEVLYWPHGKCDFRQQLPRLARQVGLDRYPGYKINDPRLIEFSRDAAHILSGVPSGNPEDRDRLPNGWYQGAMGITRIWREFYLVRRARIPFISHPESPEDRRTFLVVTAATWYYWQAGDYETQVAMFIYSLPYLNVYRWDQIKRHRQAAERLARVVHDYLAAHPPSPQSVEYRRRLDPALTHPPNAPNAPGFPTS